MTIRRDDNELFLEIYIPNRAKIIIWKFKVGVDADVGGGGVMYKNLEKKVQFI